VAGLGGPGYSPAMAPPPDDKDELKAQLDALAAKIRAHRPPATAERERQTPPGNDGFGSAMSASMKAGSEFITAILVGTAIGFGVDWLTGLKPLFTILFFLLGVAAGTVNVIRATSPKGAAK